MLPVQSAAAVVVVDLTLALTVGVGPEVEVSRLDPIPDLIELLLAHQEGVVDARYVGVRPVIHEVDADAVADLDDLERSEPGRVRETEHLGEELGAGYRV